MSTSSSKEPVRVSDHAVLRYLARATGLNVEIVREQILSSSNPAAFGAVCVRSEGMRFEIVNGAVVTVVKDHAMPSHLTIERNRRRIRAVAHPEASA
jgi:hypothetical protein